MSTLYISEYADVGHMSGVAPTGSEPANVDQTVNIGVGSAQSNAFATNTRLVRLHTDTTCSILFGLDPTATATTKRMKADQTEYFTVNSIPSLKVAVISNV